MMHYNVKIEEQARIVGCSEIGIKHKNRYDTYKPDEVDRLLVFYREKGADIVSDPVQEWRIIFHSDSTYEKMQFARYLKMVKWTDVASQFCISRAYLDKKVRVLNFGFADAVKIADAIGCKMKILKNGKAVRLRDHTDFKMTEADKVFKALGYEVAFFDKDTGERLS
jgi:hypothetical protein